MTTDIKELLPCPFCGGKAKEPNYTGIQSLIECENCRAGLCILALNRDIANNEAIAAWNRRTPVQLSAQTAEPVPFAWVYSNDHGQNGVHRGVVISTVRPDERLSWKPLYTHPAKTEQPSLSDERPKWRSDLLDGVGLDEIEAAAMKATHVLYTHPRDSNEWRENTELAKYLSAGVVIALVQAARAIRAQRQDSDKDYMCPNCVTPWKCNGPHIANGAAK